MLPDMVLTPKAWYRETEQPATHMEQLLQAALSHSLPIAPFLAITAPAFDAFCVMHKLNSLDRELSFPLDDREKRNLFAKCKRLQLPETFVKQLTRHFPTTLGKNDVFIWSSLPATPENPVVFAGEVSALATIRSWWAGAIATQGAAKTRLQLHKQPLYVVARPKHTFSGELNRKDKFLVALNLTSAVSSSDAEADSYYIDLTTGGVSDSDQLRDSALPARLPFSATELFMLARGLYRKSLYSQVCPIAGTKTKLWIQPTGKSITVVASQESLASNKAPVFAKGESTSKGIAVGQVIVVKHERDWLKVRSHHIVVTNLKLTNTSTISLKMKALVSERANLGALVASQLRELRFPVVTNVAHITKLVKNGQVISVDASKGTLYTGNPFATHRVIPLLPTSLEPKQLDNRAQSFQPSVKMPRIPLIDNPRQLSTSVVDLREQKRILLSWGSAILKELGVHPKRLWQDKQTAKITDFIESSLTVFARQCPHTILMYALSDFELPFLSRLSFAPPSPQKSLQSYFGLRGVANLLIDPSDFAHVEIKALSKAHAKRIRLDLVLPFCRTPHELIALKRFLARYHLIRGGYLKLYFRVETPVHLTQLEAYIDAGIDGIVLDMHRLSLLHSGINVQLADHAPLKNQVYQDLTALINHYFVGVSTKIPVYGWYKDYDVAYNSDFYPKCVKGFIA